MIALSSRTASSTTLIGSPSMSRSTMWPVSIASAAAIMQRNAGMTFHASNGWNPPLTCRESGVGLQPHAWPGSPASACRYNPRMIPCQSAVATVALTRGTPTDRVMWPLPVRSSANTTSPGPKRRIVPSPLPISIAPDRTKIYWRRGAMCQSLITPTGKPPPLAVRLEKALPFRR